MENVRIWGTTMHTVAIFTKSSFEFSGLGPRTCGGDIIRMGYVSGLVQIEFASFEHRSINLHQTFVRGSDWGRVGACTSSNVVKILIHVVPRRLDKGERDLIIDMYVKIMVNDSANVVERAYEKAYGAFGLMSC